MTKWAVGIYLGVIVVGGVLLAQERSAGPRSKSAGETQVPGDPTKGQAIFEGKGECLSCHRVADRGSRMYPDLSDIATQRSVEELQKALLNPSPEVAPGHRLYRVVTRDGRTITGRLLNQDVYSLQMLDSKEQLVAFQKTNLREFNFVQTPPMPSYRDKLSTEEQADLIAYLATLRGVKKQ
jgi:putative heme-binding domain-containing protein